MDNAVKTKIDYEVSQIDELIDKSDVLISLCKNKEPDFIEITAVGGILHAFYNGVENIFILIVKSLQFDFTSSSQWHRNLIDFMFAQNNFLQADLRPRLTEYMVLDIFFVIPTAIPLNGKNALTFSWSCQIFGNSSGSQ